MATWARTRGARAATLVVAALILAARPAAGAPSGTTLTPDRLSYIVNKDLAGARWTITLNLASLAPERFLSVTGNIFQSDDSPPGFVWCQVRDDSAATLDDPASVFRLRCSGSDACAATASDCARTDWRPLADLVEIPAGFFLPSREEAATAATTPALASLPAAGEIATRPAAAASPRGTTLSPDAASFLVVKDVGTDRWSISLNLIPARTVDEALDALRGSGTAAGGRLQGRRLSVTGNVFAQDGGEPTFLFCQEQLGSDGRLSDPASEFRFACQGSGRCVGNAADCASGAWRPIQNGASVRVPASFFLPPGGLPASASDPEIVVIGRTSDPPSIAVKRPGGGALATIAGSACATGRPCSLAIGPCPSVAGTWRPGEDGDCACLVDDVPAECITCGDDASRSCGAACSYEVSLGVTATVRGECLPVDDSGQCACYAGDASGVPAGQCGGALGTLCPADKCCADDVRDGCDPSLGDEDCPGVCVRSNGCDPRDELCGICLDQRSARDEACGTGSIGPGEDCCVEDGSCSNGTSYCYCKAGSVCVSDGSKDYCCTATRSQLCPDVSCAPEGADCCGNRTFCAAGSVCTDTEPVKCCSANQPQPCPDLSGCVREGSTCCGNGRACPAGRRCDFSSGELECVPVDGVADATATAGERATSTPESVGPLSSPE